MKTHPFYQKILKRHQSCQNYICVGLDPDFSKLPAHIPHSIAGLFDFLTAIIESTHDICIAYKPNISFFEALGIDGLQLLERICKKISQYNVPIILDAKRGDIGNTSQMQARYLFDYFGADATTLHPYMGRDSLEPFFRYKDRFHFVLALTSNPGAADFEKQQLASGQYVYEKIYTSCVEWHKTYQNIGVVVGATQEELTYIRKLSSELLFLIPGVGTQGGDYSQSVQVGKNQDDLVIINMSRSILYASAAVDFASSARSAIQST